MQYEKTKLPDGTEISPYYVDGGVAYFAIGNNRSGFYNVAIPVEEIQNLSSFYINGNWYGLSEERISELAFKSEITFDMVGDILIENGIQPSCIDPSLGSWEEYVSEIMEGLDYEAIKESKSYNKEIYSQLCVMGYLELDESE